MGAEASPAEIQKKIDEWRRAEKNHRLFEERMEEKENELVWEVSCTTRWTRRK